MQRFCGAALRHARSTGLVGLPRPRPLPKLNIGGPLNGCRAQFPGAAVSKPGAIRCSSSVQRPPLQAPAATATAPTPGELAVGQAVAAASMAAAAAASASQAAEAWKQKVVQLPKPKLNILFLTNAHNSMSQRAYVELTAMGHDVTVELALTEQQMVEATERHDPDLVVGPFLTKRVNEKLWKTRKVLIIHPGIHGDRGASSIDWALQEARDEWGVTVLEAHEEMDAGDIWSTNNFKISRAGVNSASITKSSLYKNEVIEAAMKGLKEAIYKFQNQIPPIPLQYSDPSVKGTLRPLMKQTERKVDWTSNAETVVRRVACSDGQPGVLDEFFGQPVFIFGAHVETELNKTGKYKPKELIATRNGAVCIATGHNGAAWITHMKKKNTDKRKYFKMHSTYVLGNRVRNLPELPLDPFAVVKGSTFREIHADVEDSVCYLTFDFYNGAMSTEQCVRLQKVIDDIAKRKDIRVLVLMGGYNYFSNGIHLNTIEAADDPALESWKNINAINDVVYSIMRIPDKITISAVQGNAGAGGTMLALAADQVYTHAGVVMNPHYRSMGLYGSEYWTYNLPNRVGQEKALELTESLRPLGAIEAQEIGLVDDVLGNDVEEFRNNIRLYAKTMAARADFKSFIQKKADRLSPAWKEQVQKCRSRELMIMKENFRDSIYHTCRQKFVYKENPTDTPQHLVKGKGFGKQLNGKLLAQHCRNEIAQEVALLKKKYNRVPGLAIVMVGENAASDVYVRMKEKWAAQVGFHSVVDRLDAKDANLVEKIKQRLAQHNADPDIHGVMIQLPLPEGIDAKALTALVHPDKDVDAFHAAHMGELATNYHNKTGYFLPCTARGIMEILHRYDIKIAGKKVVMVGASNIVGLPTALCLLRQSATVELCQVHTLDLAQSIRTADIVVAATGQAHLIKGDWIKPGAVVIDAGISVIRDGENASIIKGDVEYEAAAQRASYITPVPGGVGPMTVAMLLQNTLDAFVKTTQKAKYALTPEFLQNRDVELFVEHFDRNGDNQLDKEELYEVVHHVLRNAEKHKLPELRQRAHLAVDKLLKHYDVNLSGTLDMDELRGINILDEIKKVLEEPVKSLPLNGPGNPCA